MKLGDWLREKHMTHESFALLVGCGTSHITRLIPRRGKKQVRKPSFALAKKISEATGGQVTANDWVDDDEADEAPGRTERSPGGGLLEGKAA